MSPILMKLKLLVFALVVLAVGNAYGQDKMVSGTVTAENGEELPGVTIIVKGTQTGTISDVNGKFTIETSPGNTLVFSYVGTQPVEMQVGNQTVIDVMMKDDVEQLTELVVVGYGAQKRDAVTGAISEVDADQITEVPVLTTDQALQGRAAGVTVLNNGSPGSDPVVRIRGLATTGSNSPLVVVDGVIVQGLGDVNPNDVASVSVLKDASTTAIFGALGSNGVIMITTKGGSNDKTKISVESYAGIQRATSRFDLMNREQYLQYAENWGAATGRIDDPQFAELINNDTDWQDEIFRDAGIQSHNVAISGGNENSDFRVSANYINQEGVLLNTGSERYTFRANSNFKLGRLKVGETFATSFFEQQPENLNGGRSAIEHAIKMAPYFDVRNPNNLGGYQGPDNNLDGQDAENPVRVLELPDRENKRTNVLGSLFAEYEIIDGLKLKGQAGLDYWTFNNNSFIPSYQDGVAHSKPFANIDLNSGTHTQTMLFAHLNYIKSFGNHNFDWMILSERIRSLDTRTNTASTNTITNDLPNLTNIDSKISSEEFEYIKYGYLARMNYDYDSRYFVALSLRRDASSRFGPDNRWANFYALAGGWTLSNEDFFPDNNILTNAKLRGSYGTVGNDQIGNYRFASSITSGFYNYIFDSESGLFLAPGSTAGNVAVPDLTWETTTMTNVGLDMAFLDDRLSLSVEYYKNSSEDLLINVLQTPSLGRHNDRAPRNVGAVDVDGFEINLGYNHSDGPFQWSANVNLSTTNNTVQSLGGETLFDGNFENGNILRSIAGESLYHFYGFRVLGIFQSQEEIDNAATQDDKTAPGDLQYADLSGPNGVPDGVINNFDRTIIGNPIPDVIYGISFNASYKNFDFSLLFNGVAGNEIYNTNIWDLEGVQRFFNASPRALDAWTPDNRDTDIPRLNSDAINLQVSDRFVESGDFFRLRNISIGYTLPQTMFDGLFTKFRVYLSGQNLLTFTNYSGLDPEVGTSVVVGNGNPGNSEQYGIDRGNYPLPKMVIGGVQLNF